MPSTPECLVVVPSGRFVPTDVFLKNRLYELLETRPVSGLAGLLQRSIATSDLLVSIGPRHVPRALKSLPVEAIKPWLIELLRALYTTDPGTMLPNLCVLKPDDPRLQQLRSVEDRFVHNVVYAAHPAEPTSFIRFADFHSYLLQAKRAEFVRLAAELGAKSIKLLDTLSSRHGAGARAEAPVGGSIEFQKSSDTRFNLAATFHPHPVNPRVPTGLLWLRQEPLWRAMAEARIGQSVASFGVGFSYKQDFNVSATIAETLSGLGFSIGGSFAAFEAIEQEYLVEFFPMTA